MKLRHWKKGKLFHNSINSLFIYPSCWKLLFESLIFFLNKRLYTAPFYPGPLNANIRNIRYNADIFFFHQTMTNDPKCFFYRDTHIFACWISSGHLNFYSVYKFEKSLIQAIFKTFGQFSRTFQDTLCFQGLFKMALPFQVCANPSKRITASKQ